MSKVTMSHGTITTSFYIFDRSAVNFRKQSMIMYLLFSTSLE